MPRQLDAREQRFVEEYLIDLNPKKAAIAAGYKESTDHNKSYGWVSNSQSTKPHVFAAIQNAQQARSERTVITQDWVLETIHETVERCKQSHPVLDRKGDPVFVRTPNGDEVPAYAFDAGNVLKGVDLAGKHLGMFTTKVEHTGKDGGPIELSRVELKQKLRWLLKQKD